MKELDLTGAKLLRLWLRMGYYDYQISGEKDICTLVRMCLKSGLFGVGYLVLLTFMTTVMIAVGASFLYLGYLTLSFLTLYLPESYYAPVDNIMLSYGLLPILCVIALINCTVEVFQGKRNFAPEYMKRPLRKLFKNNTPSTEETVVKETHSSKTWIAIKEMYLSVKDKTCIKVRL